MTSDAARFEQLYDEYSHLILAYAARRTSQFSDAADVTADTFAITWRRIGEVPPAEEARLWLYGVARNVLLNHQRSTVRQIRLTAKAQAAAVDVLTTSAGDPPFVDAVINRVDHATEEIIVAALSRLSPADQEVLTLIAWEQLSNAEAATVLRCTPQTFRVRLHRARSRFAASLSRVEIDMKRTPRNGHESTEQAQVCSSHQELK